jgi:archaeosine synthase
MHYKIKKSDGPSKIGELTIDKNAVITPNLLFINTNRFNAPNFADIILVNNNKKIDKPQIQIPKTFVYPKDLSKELHLSIIKQFKKNDKNYFIIPGNNDIVDNSTIDTSALLFIVSNANQLFQQPKNFVDFIIKLKEKIGNEKLIYTPSIGEPANFALLTYIGIDFFDSISAIIAARNDTLLFSNGKYNKNDLYELPCNCPICNKYKGKPSEMNFENILSHNYYTISSEIKNVRNSIINDSLRNLVEIRVKAYPNLIAIFRNLDKYHYDFLEKRTPLTSKSKLLAVTKESLYRPEIKRFQKRVIEKYIKPKSAKILLLLPCSAKKPYSFSKSHRLFKEKINESGNPHVIHELIVTSPIGIVPRELELVYPASSYDIPVTGIWDEDEKRIIRHLLKKYLLYNKYEKIIAHLPQELMDFIEDILKNSEKTCIERPTSSESLDNLSDILKNIVKNYKKVNFRDRSRENVECLAEYQFGKDIGKKLLKDCIIRGKYPYQKILFNNKQLGMITKERGLISLTINGAKIISEFNRYWVEIYNDFTLKGSLFAPGVKDADTEIRIGDEVIVKNGNKLIAVGVAQMNGEEMKNSFHGEAVKVRHRL